MRGDRNGLLVQERQHFDSASRNHRAAIDRNIWFAIGGCECGRHDCFAGIPRNNAHPCACRCTLLCGKRGKMSRPGGIVLKAEAHAGSGKSILHGFGKSNRCAEYRFRAGCDTGGNHANNMRQRRVNRRTHHHRHRQVAQQIAFNTELRGIASNSKLVVPGGRVRTKRSTQPLQILASDTGKLRSGEQRRDHCARGAKR